VGKIVALDIATKTGIAIYEDDSILVYYIEGAPTFQMTEIMKVITPGTIVLVEDFSYFSARNPKTTANLNQRFGYIFWRLTEFGCTVEKCNVNTVRKSLGIKGRKKGEAKREVMDAMRMTLQIPLTDDESDAIALLLFHIGLKICDLANFKVSKTKRLRDV